MHAVHGFYRQANAGPAHGVMDLITASPRHLILNPSIKPIIITTKSQNRTERQ